VHRWGVERIPASWELTRYERSFVAEPDGPPPGDPGASDTARWALPPVAAAEGEPATGLVIRVLAPHLEATLDGQPVNLGRQQGALVVALVLAHPLPVHVVQANELLWPGADSSPTRLNSVVHRLRDKLGPARDAVTRTGQVLALDPRWCHVDLWEYRRQLAAGTDEALEALAGVRSTICAAERRGQDRITEHRRRFAREWLRHARALTPPGTSPDPRLHGALDALGIDPAALLSRSSTAS
jgi:hypothetical protein